MTQCETKRKNVHTIWYSLSLELNYELNKCSSVAYIFLPATGNLSDIWREERIFKSATNLTQIPLFPCWKPQGLSFSFNYGYSLPWPYGGPYLPEMFYFWNLSTIHQLSDQKLFFQPSHSCYYNCTYSTVSLLVSWLYQPVFFTSLFSYHISTITFATTFNSHEALSFYSTCLAKLQPWVVNPAISLVDS